MKHEHGSQRASDGTCSLHPFVVYFYCSLSFFCLSFSSLSWICCSMCLCVYFLSHSEPSSLPLISCPSDIFFSFHFFSLYIFSVLFPLNCFSLFISFLFYFFPLSFPSHPFPFPLSLHLLISSFSLSTSFPVLPLFFSANISCPFSFSIFHFPFFIHVPLVTIPFSFVCRFPFNFHPSSLSLFSPFISPLIYFPFPFPFSSLPFLLYILPYLFQPRSWSFHFSFPVLFPVSFPFPFSLFHFPLSIFPFLLLFRPCSFNFPPPLSFPFPFLSCLLSPFPLFSSSLFLSRHFLFSSIFPFSSFPFFLLPPPPPLISFLLHFTFSPLQLFIYIFPTCSSFPYPLRFIFPFPFHSHSSSLSIFLSPFPSSFIIFPLPFPFSPFYFIYFLVNLPFAFHLLILFYLQYFLSALLQLPSPSSSFPSPFLFSFIPPFHFSPHHNFFHFSFIVPHLRAWRHFTTPLVFYGSTIFIKLICLPHQRLYHHIYLSITLYLSLCHFWHLLAFVHIYMVSFKISHELHSSAALATEQVMREIELSKTEYGSL